MLKLRYEISNRYKVAALVVIVAVVFFSSCNLNFLRGGGSFATFSSLPSIDEDIYNERSIPNDEFFYVNVAGAQSTRRNDLLDYLIYARHEGPGVGCKISVTQESSEDLYCMLDVLEGDLLHNDIELEYNVPENMCTHLKFQLPWHYNQPVGQGPRAISKCSDDYYDTVPLIWGSSTSPECETGTAECTGSGTLSCSANTGEPSCSNAGGVPHCRRGNFTAPTCTGGGTLTHACRENGTYSPTCEGGTDSELSDDSFCPTGSVPKCSCDNNGVCDGAARWCETESQPICPCPAGGVTDKKDLCTRPSKFDILGLRVRLDLKAENSSEQGLENGCFGEYEEYTYTLGTDGGYERSNEATDESWGDDFSKVIGGLARVDIEQGSSNQEESNFSGLFIKVNNVPAPRTFPDVLGGQRESYTIPHIRSYIRAAEVLPSSGGDIKRRREYFRSVGSASCWEDEQGPDGCEIEDNDLPEDMYLNEGGGSRSLTTRKILVPGLVGHPYLTWSCLDNGLEVKHRIHLIIREWNTKEEFDRYKESSGDRGDANVAGAEGDVCSYEPSSNWVTPEPVCNDLRDLEDMLDNDSISEGDKYPKIIYSNN